MIRISISIRENQAALLRRWAQEDDRPVSAIIRQLIEAEARRRQDRCPHCGLPLGILDLEPGGEAYRCPDCDESIPVWEAQEAAEGAARGVRARTSGEEER